MTRWWREQRQYHGLAAAARLLARELWDFLRDSTPERRRARYGDLDYDFDTGANTTSGGVRWQTRLRGLAAGSYYQPADPALFRETLRAAIARDNSARFTFVDLGCGKGRALLMAAELPFQRVIGVELLPELYRVALENVDKALARTDDAALACRDVKAVLGDARDFEFPAGPLVLFMFNPLPEAALKQVIDELERSLSEESRELRVLYHNPVLEHVLAGRAGLRRVKGDLRYAIYSNDVKSS